MTRPRKCRPPKDWPDNLADQAEWMLLRLDAIQGILDTDQQGKGISGAQRLAMVARLVGEWPYHELELDK